MSGMEKCLDFHRAFFEHISHQSVKKFNFSIEMVKVYLLLSIDVCAHKTCSVPNIDSEDTRNQRKYRTGDESKIGEDIHVLKLQFIESLTKI